MTLRSKFSVSLSAQLANVLDLSTVFNNTDYNKVITLETGVAANQADKIFHDNRIIAPSNTDTLDVAGVLSDPLGVTFTLAKLKGLLVYADPTNVNNVNVQRPAANGVPLFGAASDFLPVKPGGLFLWVAPDLAGIAVTAAAADLIDFVNSGAGTSVKYDVIIVGTSA